LTVHDWSLHLKLQNAGAIAANCIAVIAYGGKVFLRSLILLPFASRDRAAASLSGDAMEELQKSIIKLQDDLDVKVFRPLQKRAFDASSECCNGEKSRENFQACLEHAGRATAQAEHAVMLSLNEFQQRVQRCVVQ